MPSQPKSKSTSSKECLRLTIVQKVLICKMAGVRCNNTTALAEWAARAFDMPRPPSLSTLYKILKKKPELLLLHENTYDRKKIGDPEVAEMDRALVAEFDKMEAEVRTVTDYGLMYRSKMFVDEHFKFLPTNKRPGFSKGWMWRFKKRHGIMCHRKHGESASVSAEVIAAGHADMREITDAYALQDIYNLDETAFFYHMESPRTLSRRSKVAGYKADKTRIRMSLTVNADGSDKVPLLFIGKSKNPRVFKGHDVSAELGIEYTNSKKAWMNGDIFLRWLHTLDLRMKREERQVLLLVDNVSSHLKPLTPLTNVRLEFLPKNTTSVLQPLDQGIIASVKSHFSRIKVENSINRYVAGLPQEKISIFTALSWAAQAWREVTPETIQNCWIHSGIIPRPTETMAMRHILCYESVSLR